MSIHPSLSSSDKDKKARSVLKRTERLKLMMEKGKWKEGDNIFGLPKLKTLRIKIKKEKVEKAPEEAVAAAAATEGAAPAAGSETTAKTAQTTPAAGKASTPKSQDKK